MYVQGRSVRCNASKSAFVFGLNGYTSIAGTVRHSASQPRLISKGWRPYLFDPGARMQLSEEAQEHLATCTHVLSSIPPLGLPLYDPVLREQLRLLKDNSCQWVGYLSSTGVYGDWCGEWVDESSPCKSASSRGIVRKAAEDCWLQAHREDGLPVHIFRLGGIYGPGRSALEAAAAEDKAPLTASSATKQRRARQRYTSRVHVLDICTVLEASMQRPAPGSVYNVVDDDPAPRQQVVRYARLLLQGLAPEEAAARVAEDEPQTSSSGASGGGPGQAAESSRVSGAVLEEKRVRNDLIKQQLQVRFAFPSYREGLAALHAGQIAPFTREDLAVVAARSGGSGSSEA